MSEKRVCALSFPDLEGKFGYFGFTSTDPRVHKWCLDLFNHYWDISEVRTDYHWFRRRNLD
jgi:predicted transcriptional regulator